MSQPAQEVVLIVDDDRTFCVALASALRRYGFGTVLAHGYDEALAEAEAWGPTRAVVDLRMPGKGGLELVAALKQGFPDLLTIVLTGYGSIATAVEAIKLGAHHYLTKPATVTEIMAAFERSQPDSSVRAPNDPMPLGDLQREHIEQVLIDAAGNVSEAARRLGMHRRTLQRKLARRRSGDA